MGIDLENLQNSLNRLEKRLHTCQIKISYTKCSLLYINGMTNPHNVDMLLGDDKIVTVDSVKGLGIAVGSELKLSKHFGKIVARAHARVNLIHQCFLSRDVNTLTRVFTAYVRPLLEYGSSVWSPHFNSEINRIESAQRRFTKRLRFLNNMSIQTTVDLS